MTYYGFIEVKYKKLKYFTYKRANFWY